jgi:hypothetical protein
MSTNIIHELKKFLNNPQQITLEFSFLDFESSVFQGIRVVKKLTTNKNVLTVVLVKNKTLGSVSFFFRDGPTYQFALTVEEANLYNDNNSNESLIGKFIVLGNNPIRGTQLKISSYSITIYACINDGKTRGLDSLSFNQIYSDCTSVKSYSYALGIETLKKPTYQKSTYQEPKKNNSNVPLKDNFMFSKMDKLKIFFFNKVVKNKNTNFNELLNSYLRGFGKIFLLLIGNSILISMGIFFDIDYRLQSFFTIIIMLYILFNRFPNQIMIHRNYFYSKKLKKESNNVNKKVVYEKMGIGIFPKNKWQRRFIILYVFLNLFALTVNEFNIQGALGNCTTMNILTTNNHNETIFDGNNAKRITANKSDVFYPFVTFKDYYYLTGNKCDECYNGVSCYNFYGIFVGYDTTEFIVYIGLLLLLLIVRKIW